uniref:N-acetylgalactosamine kinase-like n=1 Tax=Phallusia mammillata TaxID=59560 RepID=A0A6F9DDA6_9ASCI|nr:N-acetylgalactosamine kinase-like [Phallusia mammillata]
MAVVASNLSSLKEDNAEKYKRYKELANSFEAKYGKVPKFICCAPGRVNLIGEHIDYCGYSVLPMAVSQDISMAVATTNDGSLNFSNLEGSFQDYNSSTKTFDIDSSKPEWFHYILCGFKGVYEFASLDIAAGIQVMVHGTVPKAAGMSSSSALVCAAGLATAFSNNCQISRHEMADICAKCERYIGTQGGGMDQSISFLAEKGTAKLISFNPLRAEDVILPDGAVFVITNSCVKMEKAATAHFNIRVAECKIATQILAKHKSIDRTDIKKFIDVQNALKASFSEMLSLVKEVFHTEPYTREEICRLLEITDDVLKTSLLSQNTQDVQSFKLYQRSKHVFGEAYRVHQFKDVCNNKSDSNKLSTLGNLMTESHMSCSELYECSCPQLDTLTQLCRDAGALGSRLTGAGWGGCAVSLVPEKSVPNFLNQVQAGYYNKMSGINTENVMFASQPGGGAQVYTM